jgi:hypothetical protein
LKFKVNKAAEATVTKPQSQRGLIASSQRAPEIVGKHLRIVGKHLKFVG